MPKYSIPHHIWRAIYPVLIWFGLAFFVLIAAGIPYGIRLGVEAPLNGEALPDMEMMTEQIETFITDNTMLFQLISNAIAIFIFALMWRKIREKLPKYENSKLNILAVGLTVLCFAGFNYLLIAVFAITDIYRFFPSYEDHAELLFSGGLAVRLIGIGLLSPIVEELLCRGIIFNRLSAWMPAWAAALASSALFAVMHFELFQILYAFVVGLAFCIVYMRFRNLWIAIIGHVAFNLASAALLEILAATDTEEINSLYLLLPALLITAVCTALMLKRTKPAVLIPEAELEPALAVDGSGDDGGPDETVAVP